MTLNLNLKDPIFWCILAAIICVIVALSHCSHTPVTIPVDLKKSEIVKEKHVADSIREVIVYKDRIRVNDVHHYHAVRYDSLIPCPDKLAIADTVIFIDSSEISSLKASLFVKGLIIANQDTVIRNDSIAYRKLAKKLRWQKFKTKVSLALAGVVGVAWLVK